MTVRATIIWRFENSDYQGNNWFFAKVCEELYTKAAEVIEIVGKRDGLKFKVSADVDVPLKKVSDNVEDQISELVEITLLPCPYLVIVPT